MKDSKTKDVPAVKEGVKQDAKREKKYELKLLESGEEFFVFRLKCSDGSTSNFTMLVEDASSLGDILFQASRMTTSLWLSGEVQVEPQIIKRFRREKLEVLRQCVHLFTRLLAQSGEVASALLELQTFPWFDALTCKSDALICKEMISFLELAITKIDRFYGNLSRLYTVEAYANKLSEETKAVKEDKENG